MELKGFTLGFSLTPIATTHQQWLETILRPPPKVRALVSLPPEEASRSPPHSAPGKSKKNKKKAAKAKEAQQSHEQQDPPANTEDTPHVCAGSLLATKIGLLSNPGRTRRTR